MSKDFTPSRADIEAFGQAGSIINEMTGELMKVEPIVSDMERLVDGMDKMVSGMEKMAKALKPTTVQVNKPKFKKSVGALSSMFKTMSGLSPKAFIIEKLLQTLSPLMKIFEVFQPILDAVSALLTVMVISAMKPMYAVLLPLVPKIMELSPLFARIGTVIGEMMVMGLEPLLLLFDIFYPTLKPALEGLAEFLEGLRPFYPILFPLIPVITLIAQGFARLMSEGSPARTILITIASAFSNLFQMGGITNTILEKIGITFYNLSLLATPFLNMLREAITLIQSTTGGGGGGGGTTGGGFGEIIGIIGDALNVFGNAIGGNIGGFSIASKIPGFQAGGVITKPTIAKMGEDFKPEEIVPLKRGSVLVDEIRENSYLLGQIKTLLEKQLNLQESGRGITIYRNVHG